MNDSMPTPAAMKAALKAIRRGYQVVALRPNVKRPIGSGWQTHVWPRGAETTMDEVVAYFTEKGEGFTEPLNMGVLLGKPSGSLIDIDLDHPKTRRVRDLFLPRTSAVSQHDRKPSSHYWYIAAPNTLPGTRQYQMPRQASGADGEMIVELRSTGTQTVIPPSIWTDKDDPTFHEPYNWRGMPWGGDHGPEIVNGAELAVRVACLALTTVLIDAWPGQGGRHGAYLALAGGLLRDGQDVSHFWGDDNMAGVIIEAVAIASGDEDGAEQRVKESIGSTVKALQATGKAVGWPKLAEIIGQNAVDTVIAYKKEIESLAGAQQAASTLASAPPSTASRPTTGTPGATASVTLPGTRTPDLSPADPNSPAAQAYALAQAKLAAKQGGGDSGAGDDPNAGIIDLDVPQEAPGAGTIASYLGTWAEVPQSLIEDALTGKLVPAQPEVLWRAAYANPNWKQGDDPALATNPAQALFYSGSVNMLYGSSESAKSWIALHACLEHIRQQPTNRALYIDLESGPAETFDRLMRLGGMFAEITPSAGRFKYVNPEQPLAGMQRGRWGNDATTPIGTQNQYLFEMLMDEFDPSLVIVDGMSVLYGVHGLDSNSTGETDVITGWLKGIARRRLKPTVVVLDHVGKGAERGSLPIGSQHKMAMVQGTMLQAWTIQQPMDGKADGEVELVVVKDRPGQVRKVSAPPSSGAKAQIAARVLIDSATNPGSTQLTVEPPRNLTIPNSGATGPLTVPGASNARAQRDAEARKRETEENRRVLDVFADDLTKSLTLQEIFLGMGLIGPGLTIQQAIDQDMLETKTAKRWRAVVKRLATGATIYLFENVSQGRAARYELMTTSV